MEKKWYQDWRSWVTIVLLLFVPTFFIGLVFMWCCAPWSRKTKYWVTGIFVGIPLIIMLISFLLTFATSGKKVSQAADYKRKADVEIIVSSAHKFCIEKNRCPSNLDELKQTDFSAYLRKIPTDPDTKKEYSYQLIKEGKDCLIKTVLSTGEEFSSYCMSTSLP